MVIVPDKFSYPQGLDGSLLCWHNLRIIGSEKNKEYSRIIGFLKIVDTKFCFQTKIVQIRNSLN